MTVVSASAPRIVVFDIGGVLLDWDPRYLYRQLFDGDDAAMERFLADVCSPAWNLTLDAGRPFAEATAELVARFPEERARIEAYDHRWGDMVPGAFEGTVEILAELRERGTPVYALSNWHDAKFQLMRARFPFLDWFDGVVLSGNVGLVKPDPAIFAHLFATFGFAPGEAVFIDDNAANVAQGAALGMRAIRFASPAQVRAELRGLGLLA